MRALKSYFIFTKGQQAGIFLLVVFIIILQLLYFFADFNSENKISLEDEARIIHFQRQVDSLKQIALNKNEPKIYPFNPNLITDYKGYTLGMSLEEIDRLHAFRAANKWVNSAVEFQKVTLISDSLLNKISPYFKFPDWVKNSNARSSSERKANEATEKIRDLNNATFQELVEVRGIGEVLANRILKYRVKIGGFISDLQLKDIYGLNFEARTELLRHFSVLTIPTYEKYNINEASVLEIASVPYLDYEVAREIVNYRTLHERIATFEELAKIREFPSEKIDRIALYLTLE